MSTLIHGMHGMGDNVHQRAIVKAFIDRGEDVWLETPWPCLYHDLDVHLVGKGSRLRTQAKNAIREAERFAPNGPPAGAREVTVWYPPQSVRDNGSVLGAMAHECGVPIGDFRMEVPERWKAEARRLVLDRKPEGDTRPVLVTRPLVDRREWSGCQARNPDRDAYRTLFNAFREQFYVVAIADLVPGIEWLDWDLPSDARFYEGELNVEAVAGLMAQSALVYASPGFAIPLAQCVGTPSICVFGGYENGSSFSAGAKLTPHLPIEPIHPCQCFSHTHDCQKSIDIGAAWAKIAAFIEEHAHA